MRILRDADGNVIARIGRDDEFEGPAEDAAAVVARTTAADAAAKARLTRAMRELRKAMTRERDDDPPKSTTLH